MPSPRDDHFASPWESQPDGRKWLARAFLGLVIVFLGMATFLYLKHARNVDAVTNVSAISGRLTLVQDDAGNITTFFRQTSPEVYFRVTLKDAPIGTRLALDCDWLDPTGQIVHQNHYQTRTIDRSIWPTHARWRFGAASPTGTWTVRMSVEGRTLRTSSFRIEDAGKGVAGEVALPGEFAPLQAPVDKPPED